ncbi:MAG: hypothetical protein M1308_21845 [Actinobacteria bacterium]|nr:hypothetical protein [Actinomycetota bacterium]
MKRIVLVLIVILIGGLAVIGRREIQPGELGRFCKANPSLLRFGIINKLCMQANLNATLKCSYATHACENITPQENSGNYKITIMVNGKPGKDIEVDLGLNAGPVGDSYIKVTDINGVAIFKGIPPDTYYQGVNVETFPKEYGDAYKTWTWSKVTIIKGKTTEMKMNLHSN